MRWQLLRSVKKRQRHNKNQYVLSARHRCQRQRLQNPICMESTHENMRVLCTSSTLAKWQLELYSYGSMILVQLSPFALHLFIGGWPQNYLQICHLWKPNGCTRLDRTSIKEKLQKSNQVGRLLRFDSLLISTARCSLHGNGIQGIHWLDALCLRSANYLGLRLPPAGTELAGAQDSVQQKDTHAAQQKLEVSQSGSNTYIITQAFFFSAEQNRWRAASFGG